MGLLCIARTARNKVTDAEAKALEGELSGILDWVKQLDEVDTRNVEPMKSGMMVERRDQVLMTCLVFFSFWTSTFFSRWSSTNGPFLRLRGLG